MGISVHTEEGILWGFWAWTLVFGFMGLDLGIWFYGLGPWYLVGFVGFGPWYLVGFVGFVYGDFGPRVILKRRFNKRTPS